MADELRSANVAVIVDALPDFQLRAASAAAILEKPPTGYLNLRAANIAVIYEVASSAGRVQGPAAQSM